MGSEDGRVAATLKTTLACAVIASAFAAIAVEAAIAVFVMDKRVSLKVFMILAVAAAVALILSSILGARGIAEVYKPGYDGKWDKEAGKGFFSAQALFGSIGLLLIVISSFCGDPKPETKDCQSIKADIDNMRNEITILKNSAKQEVSCPPTDPHAKAKNQTKKKAHAPSRNQ